MVLGRRWDSVLMVMFPIYVKKRLKVFYPIVLFVIIGWCLSHDEGRKITSEASPRASNL